MQFKCCFDNRRNEVLAHPALNGIDFLEVQDNPADPPEIRQTQLYVHFIKDIVPLSLQPENILITGGERITGIKVISADILLGPPGPGLQKTLVVKVEAAGDFSTYTLRLVQDNTHTDPPQDYDPILSSVDFSFKVRCDTPFDCKTDIVCTDEPVPAPDINYLAKDYATFRQLMLDRMSLLMPQWQERNPADVGITLIELLAYAADYMSYRQDAVATEAYLGTARKRISVRRHARLVDYFMHDGSNARTWAHIKTRPGVSSVVLDKSNIHGITRLITQTSELPPVIRTDDNVFREALHNGALVFELMHPVTLHALHNEMEFYTWSQQVCWLYTGAVTATLQGHFPDLHPGLVLIFAEIRGPRTGEPGDADPAHRHPVMLTKVRLFEDPMGNVPVTIIEWHEADALPFPLCISYRDEEGNFVTVSVAWGNNVLADHGHTIFLPLEPVPEKNNRPLPLITADDPCEPQQPVPVIPRYRPLLPVGPVTQAVHHDTAHPPVSAVAAMQWDLRDLLPEVILQAPDSEDWIPRRDLLDSGGDEPHFVLEAEDDQHSYIRFGDGRFGRVPKGGTLFTAVCRTGNGLAGNIGINTLVHLVSDDPAITSGPAGSIAAVWNPLPAKGGKEPETISEVRQKAPAAFRKQERAVTLQDYEDASKGCASNIQRSAASFRWTGSWRTVFITVDQLGGAPVGASAEEELRSCLEKYRMAGHDLEVDSPRYVSVEIEMTVCVKKDYFLSDVKKALLEVFSNRLLPDGTKGVFHPDNFTFGQAVYLSPVYATAQAVEGVEAVKITKFQRQGNIHTSALTTGKLSLSRLEIARLDNDPNFPERGVFNLIMKGGR